MIQKASPMVAITSGIQLCISSSRLILYLSSNTLSNTEYIRSGSAPVIIKKGGAPVNKATPGAAGRNQPCPCGSGKKYKHCCGKG